MQKLISQNWNLSNSLQWSSKLKTQFWSRGTICNLHVQSANILKKLFFFCQLDDLFILITGALSENGRIQKLSGVITAFEKIMSAHRGEVFCTVTTAKVNLNEFI